MRCPVCEGADSRHFQTVDARAYARCPHCEATFLLPGHLPSPQAERAEYELHRNTPDDAGYRRFLSQLATPLLQRLAPASHGLDFGCGPGPVLAGMLREAGHRVGPSRQAVPGAGRNLWQRRRARIDACRKIEPVLDPAAILRGGCGKSAAMLDWTTHGCSPAISIRCM